jgi:signal transduction histidine kinase
MIGGSLRLRLAAAGAAAILVALALAAFGLTRLFEAHVERRALAELSAHLDQIAAGLSVDAAGAPLLDPAPADPRFVRPLSGLYWRIGEDDAAVVSRSLWDGTLALAADALRDGAEHVHAVEGPRGEALLAVERVVTLPPSRGGARVRIAVALDRAEIAAATRAFAGGMSPYLGLLVVALSLGGWAQLALGLAPLRALGARLAAVRSGATARMGAGFPAELAPLTAEIDALLAAREADVARARARAADLAHGLKTPLQALMGEAARLRAEGRDTAAEGVEQVAHAMRRQVDRELARARTARDPRRSAADAGAAVGRVAAVLKRTPDGARLDWRVGDARGLRLRIDPDDLTEALGAVLENAARHAASRIEVDFARSGAAGTIRVRDDGPGAPPDALASLAERGHRLDQREGAGLGLAIASEILEAAGGGLALENAHPGLAVTLTAPAA